MAADSITVSGDNFIYTSSKCFALYSQNGNFEINNGPYTIKGLIYSANTTIAGDIKITANQSGLVCGALVAGRDIEFSGEGSVPNITNIGDCSPCLRCNDICQ